MTKFNKETSKEFISAIRQRSQDFIQPKYCFCPKNDNAFQLLVNGDQFYPAMLSSINDAQTSIYIIQYIFETSSATSEFINALINATKRKVKVWLLLDAYGSKKLDKQDRYQLTTAGITLIFYNPFKKYHFIKYLHRDHRKLLVVDNKTAFIGGAGISDDYNYPVNHPTSWHDIVVKISGELAQDCQQLAIEQVNQYEQIHRKSETNIDKLDLSLSQGRLLISNSWHHNEIQRAIINATLKAKNKIWIATPYFIPTRKLRKRLKKAARRGCDVRLLLPGKNSDHPWVSQISKHHYKRMLNNGVKIFEYQKNFTHAKAILCDEWVCIGSSNLDRWNQKFNHELNLEVLATQLACDLEKLFESGFNDSIQISPTLWAKRSRIQRMREWLWCKISIWIDYFTHKLP